MMISPTKAIILVAQEATRRIMVEDIVDATLTTTIINTKINTILEAMVDNHMEWASKIITTNAVDMGQPEWRTHMACNREVEIINPTALNRMTMIKRERKVDVEMVPFNSPLLRN